MKSVIHDRDNSHSIMASWNGNFVYNGRPYPYSSRRCYNCIYNKIN